MLKFNESPKERTGLPEREDVLISDKNMDVQKPSSDEKAAPTPPEEIASLNTISLAKLAANRRNAQKATGPKTAEGKERSRWNAVKHGLLSKRLALADSESNDAFVRLLASLSEGLAAQRRSGRDLG
jgi:hypothetical protein